MGRKLTLKQLKFVKGWPYSRQYTHELVKDGKIPAPEKPYPNAPPGSRNVWDETLWDAHQAGVKEGKAS